MKISYAIQQMISFYKGNIHDIDHQILLEIYYLVKWEKLTNQKRLSMMQWYGY